MIAAGQSYYYVTDRQGSVRQYVDVGGNVRAQYEYDAYGNRSKIGGDLDSDMGYSGLFNHAATGLDFALFEPTTLSTVDGSTGDPIGELAALQSLRLCRQPAIDAGRQLGIGALVLGGPRRHQRRPGQYRTRRNLLGAGVIW